jgi:hypothetical protein
MRNQSGLHQDDRRSGPPRLRAKSGRRAETHLWRKRKLAAECVRVVWNCGNTAIMEAARHTPGGSERPSRHPRRARNPPYCRPVAPADNTPLTHGELPCPNCGYQRRGLELERPCPECGARGFDGELIVSGLPGVEPESKRSRSLYQIANAIVVIVLILIPSCGPRPDGRVRTAGLAVAGTLAAIALGFYIAGVLRRRRERATNLSLERVALEFRPDVVVVRQRELDREVPYRSIVRFDTKEDLPKRRTRVWLVTRDRLMHAATDEPIMMIVGTLADQRAIATELHARISSKRS